MPGVRVYIAKLQDTYTYTHTYIHTYLGIYIYNIYVYALCTCIVAYTYKCGPAIYLNHARLGRQKVHIHTYIVPTLFYAHAHGPHAMRGCPVSRTGISCPLWGKKKRRPVSNPGAVPK